MIFKDRTHAGEILAGKLLKYKNKNPLVLALPRGGVPVAAEIANKLGAPLEVLIVRKIGAPFNSELAIGAICESDEPTLNTIALSQIGFEPNDVSITLKSEKAEVKRQIELFRQGNELNDLTRKFVIVVDDGLATGATMKAAIKFLVRKGVEHIVIAVPVAPSSTARVIRSRVEELVTVVELEDLYSVGQWYRDFSQVSDSDVLSFLTARNQDKRELRAPQKSKSVEMELVTQNLKIKLKGELNVFPEMKALIIFTHGSGSNRKSTRNTMVADVLHQAGYGTLLFDLLTEAEEKERKNVFNIQLLSQRLVSVTKWIRSQSNYANLKVGYFGASTGAAAALVAAAQLPDRESVFAVVSRGGRPDLAAESLKQLKVPTLLLVGGKDFDIIELNRQAQKTLINSKMSIIPNATHLFEEPGTLREVARQASQWFEYHVKSSQKTIGMQSADSHV